MTSSGMRNLTLLRHTLEVTTPDRLMFSADHPFQRPTRTDLDQYLTAFPHDAARDGFTSGNARALFGIEGPVG